MPYSDIPIFKPKSAAPLPALTSDALEQQRVVVVGSGPVGLAMALDLGLRGQKVVLLSRYDFIPHGSKALCFAKQSLDIFDRLGIGERVVEKGVIWNVGKVFWGDDPEPVFEFDMLPVKDQKNPGFVNIQQYYVEDFLVDAIDQCPNVEIRWGHEVTAVESGEHETVLDVDAGSGAYKVQAEYVLACDGSKSFIRQAMGLDFEGRVFEDNFLIADVSFEQERPSERWFWFDPPFNRGETALLHKQPDGIWRLDFQLGWDIDRDAATKPENVAPYVKGMIGDDVPYNNEWISVYTFQCRRMANFVHGGVVFVGDSAHLVSPFGARGCNGGLADSDNLGWKLDLILRGLAGASLLSSYDDERIQGSDENILNSTRSTDFMTPKDERSRSYRDAVLELSKDHSFARPFINSGRLSTPTPYPNSPLSTGDADEWNGGIAPGHPAVDAPMDDANGGFLLDAVGREFSVLHFGDSAPETELPTIQLSTTSEAAKRFDATSGATYLLRPDQVVAARWKSTNAKLVEEAYSRAIGGVS